MATAAERELKASAARLKGQGVSAEKFAQLLEIWYTRFLEASQLFSKISQDHWAIKRLLAEFEAYGLFGNSNTPIEFMSAAKDLQSPITSVLSLMRAMHNTSTAGVTNALISSAEQGAQKCNLMYVDNQPAAEKCFIDSWLTKALAYHASLQLCNLWFENVQKIAVRYQNSTRDLLTMMYKKWSELNTRKKATIDQMYQVPVHLRPRSMPNIKIDSQPPPFLQKFAEENKEMLEESPQVKLEWKYPEFGKPLAVSQQRTIVPPYPSKSNIIKIQIPWPTQVVPLDYSFPTVPSKFNPAPISTSMSPPILQQQPFLLIAPPTSAFPPKKGGLYFLSRFKRSPAQ
jgi:hypothetical protein